MPRSRETFESELTAKPLFDLCSAEKTAPRAWFSIGDCIYRYSLTVGFFYRSLLFEPISLLRFSWSFNNLWHGPVIGPVLTLCLPVMPVAYAVKDLAQRIFASIRSLLPGAKPNWQMEGPGRIFFLPPDTLIASLLWDWYQSMSNFSGSYLQFGTDLEAIEHSWYDRRTTKEFWCAKLDAAGARRPQQLAAWDGKQLQEMGPGIAAGMGDLVVKISDSYLGIGDRVIKRGVGGLTAAAVQAQLAKDQEYVGKTAIANELVFPTTKFPVSSNGSGVHSLDIITMRTRDGVRVLSVILWTDCKGWSSHSSTAGYLVDVETETVLALTAWYSPYFAKLAKQSAPLVGHKLPGVRDACKSAVAAHSLITFPWLTTVGWDAMLTDDGPVFFEGNIAGFRTPRRMFLSLSLLRAFIAQLRGKGSPVPL